MRILPITQEENYVAERTYVAKVIFLIHFIYFEKKNYGRITMIMTKWFKIGFLVDEQEVDIGGGIEQSHADVPAGHIEFLSFQ